MSLIICPLKEDLILRALCTNVCGSGSVRTVFHATLPVWCNPPGKSARQEDDLAQHIVDTIDQVRNNNPNCGVAILGAFNKLDTEDLLLLHDLKQVVESATRGMSVLDLITTSFSDLYCKPEFKAPLGSANHVIFWNTLVARVETVTKPYQ